ncbi:MAG: hypothetical protein SVM80_12000 [Halobacteriota archaeon]|nr:hypothetical protein [Halobacteriota archaeon]
MKKIISVVGIVILVMSLALISGCAERETETTPVETPEPLVTINDTTDTASPTATPEPSATGDATTNETVGSVSQEDLDKLKEDLEELEYEDLEGVSED